MTVTARDWAVPEPHILFAVTETFPDKLPANAVIEFVVDELLQVDGNVQV